MSSPRLDLQPGSNVIFPKQSYIHHSVLVTEPPLSLAQTRRSLGSVCIQFACVLVFSAASTRSVRNAVPTDLLDGRRSEGRALISDLGAWQSPCERVGVCAPWC